MPTEKHAPIDAAGKNLRVGDWVRIVTVPLSISTMPAESKTAFSRAVGYTFQVEGFDDLGCIEIDMWPKISADTIWIEPFCVRRTRRYKKVSKALRKKLEAAASPLPPSHELRFELKLRPGVSWEDFGGALIGLGTSGGFAWWPSERRIKGSVYGDIDEPDALAMLERARNHALTSGDVEESSFELVIQKE